MIANVVTEATEIVDGEKPPFALGKDELNLAEFPIALLSETAPQGLRTLEFQDQIYDKGKKRLVNRKLTIEGSEAYGLPTAKDDEVILALLQLSKQRGFQTRKLDFTRYELIALLGWSNTGQSYGRIELALQRWVSVTLRYENAWWDKSEERWTSGAFHIVDDFEINDSREQTRQLTLLASHIRWNERIYKSFLDGHLKTIRYDVYVSLRHPTTKRMYRFLDKRFHHGRSCEFDLHDFAYEHIGLTRSYKDCGKLKEKLAPAIKELEEIGFLEPLPRERRYQKTGKGRWRILLIRRAGGEAEHPAKAAPAAELAPSPPSSGLVADLVARGVSEATANGLDRAYPPERIAAKIEVFDWLVERKDRRIAKSPPGYLVTSIEKDYSAPTGFEPRATRDARRATGERKRREEQDERERSRREDDARVARQQAVNAYWDALIPTEQTQLEGRAVAEATPDHLETLASVRNNRHLRNATLALIREAYIIRLLQDRGTLPTD